MVVHHRWDDEGENRSYRLVPFYLFVCRQPMRSARLHDAKKGCLVQVLVKKHAKSFTWELPADTFGGAVRVQVEGTKSLQIAQIVVIKGGATVAISDDH